MQNEVKRLAVLQTGKVLAILYGLGAVIVLPFIVLAISVSPKGAAGAIPMIIMLVLYPLPPMLGAHKAVEATGYRRLTVDVGRQEKRPDTDDGNCNNDMGLARGECSLSSGWRQ